MSVSNGAGSVLPGDAPPVAADIFGMTHPGRVRTANEDQYFIATLQKAMRVDQTSLEDATTFARLRGSAARLLVVADGASGLLGAKQASGAAVETLAEHIGETIGCYYTADVDREQEFLTDLQDAVERAHQQVLKLDPTRSQGPATTLTMVALIWPRAYVIHVGDSRAYYFRAGRLRQLTRDQTAYEDLLDQGLITEDEGNDAGLKSRLKNVLTSALGAQIKPSTGLIDLEPGDTVLLCTDGLTRHVSDTEIAGILGAGAGAEASCHRLVDLTLERGARDNVTVIVGHFAAA